MEIRTVGIIGLGALGLMFGHQMQQHLPEGSLYVLADARRIACYRREGFSSNGEAATFQYIQHGRKTAPMDLLIFSVKATDLDRALADAQCAIGPETIVLSLLNGITSEAHIKAAYPACHVLYSIAQGMDAVKVGNQVRYGNMGMIAFGEEDGSPSAQVDAVAALLQKAQIPYERPADMRRRLWGKLMANVGINQTSAVYGVDYGGLQRPGEPRDMMLLAMREVLAISEKMQTGLTEEDFQYWLSVIDRLTPAGVP